MDPAHERNTILTTLQVSVTRLEQAMNIRLIPPEGASFGYALRGARDTGGVAAVSGGIKEEDIDVLNPVVDGYGIGTSISNAPVVDYAMDIMEIGGEPLAKRGKWSGSKSVLRCAACGKGSIVPLRDTPVVCRCGGIDHDILVPVLDRGNPLLDMPSHKAIRDYVLGQMEGVDLGD